MLFLCTSTLEGEQWIYIWNPWHLISQQAIGRCYNVVYTWEGPLAYVDSTGPVRGQWYGVWRWCHVEQRWINYLKHIHKGVVLAWQQRRRLINVLYPPIPLCNGPKPQLSNVETTLPVNTPVAEANNRRWNDVASVALHNANATLDRRLLNHSKSTLGIQPLIYCYIISHHSDYTQETLWTIILITITFIT